MRETNFAMIREQLDETGRAYVRVTGTGMMPLLRPGRDRVIVDRTHYIRRGDIVLFRYAGRYILHRVLDPSGEKIVIRGDGVPEGCEYPSREEVFGRVKRIIKKGERPVDPYTGGRMAVWRIWELMRPLRRYMLALYRRLVWPGFCRK